MFFKKLLIYKKIIATLNNIEFDFFCLADTLFIFVWIVFSDGTLMHKDIFSGIISLKQKKKIKNE